MANISVTHTFSNSTTADASQVNTNFTDIINGTSDGTKDFSISALTCAGAATFNGNVTLGNATSDDVTVTGSLASTIPVKTTYSYDIGSATIGMRSVYLGSSDSAARSTRLIGATVASSYTFTLPTSGGTTGMFLLTDGSAVTSWRYPNKTVSKTTTYTATGDESVILCDTSGGAWTLTLPAAASFTGKHYFIKKTTNDFTVLTIDGNASETIDGATTTTLNTQYESLEIVSDGSNWHSIARYIPGIWTAYTPTFNSLGTVSSIAFYWQRQGDSINIRGRATCGTATAAVASFNIPTGLAFDTGKIPDRCRIGSYARDSANAEAHAMIIDTAQSTANVLFGLQTGSVADLDAANGNTLFGAEIFSCDIKGVPVSGWKG